MKLPKISFDCQLFSRALIGLLFIIAGLSKLGAFSQGSKSVDVFKNFYSQLHLGITFLPTSVEPLVGALVILIEIPIAFAYILGVKKNWTGGALIAFTALVTIFFHNPFNFKPVFSFDFIQLVQALKNIAIIGGLVATLDCGCKTCVVVREEHKAHKGTHHTAHHA